MSCACFSKSHRLAPTPFKLATVCDNVCWRSLCSSSCPLGVPPLAAPFQAICTRFHPSLAVQQAAAAPAWEIPPWAPARKGVSGSRLQGLLCPLTGSPTWPTHGTASPSWAQGLGGAELCTVPPSSPELGWHVLPRGRLEGPSRPAPIWSGHRHHPTAASSRCRSGQSRGKEHTVWR